MCVCVCVSNPVGDTENLKCDSDKEKKKNSRKESFFCTLLLWLWIAIEPSVISSIESISDYMLPYYDVYCLLIVPIKGSNTHMYL